MATLGLGLAALGRPGYMTLNHADDVPDASEAAMRAAAEAVFDAAWASGVRHFDTARSYGLAESFLGQWLERRGHAGAFVSSKWGYRYTAGFARKALVHEVKEHSQAHFESQWRETDALLGSRLGLYQVHSLTLESPALRDEALLRRLIEVRNTHGVALGASVTGARQGEVIDAMVALEVEGVRVFDWVQATWNLLERSAGPALLRARSAGLRVIVKEALANGRLTSRGTHSALLDEARSHGVTPDALALACALAQPFVDVVLSGATTLPQLESNLRACDLAAPPELLSSLALPAAQYWNERAHLAWT